MMIPVPSGTPGLRVDPLTSPEIPVTPPVVAPPAEDTSGLSRREMRKLREQAAASHFQLQIGMQMNQIRRRWFRVATTMTGRTN